MTPNEHTKLLNELKNTKKGLEDLKRENYILSEQLKMKSNHLHLILMHTPVLLFSVTPQGFIELSIGNGLEHYKINAATYIGQFASEVFQHNPELLQAIEKGKKGEALHLKTSFLQLSNIPISIEPIFDEDKKVTHIYIISYVC
ncbi:MAG: hypothetical protein GY810_13585 [Aureispira sp.]|nr:hypothetical protein [Aureispira sp.]